MKLDLKARTWHTWTGILLAMPLLIVGSTAVFMSHNRVLGTENIKVAARWLPGYRAAAAQAPQAYAILTSRAGATLIGTQAGLYRLEGDKLVAVQEFTDTPVRGLAETAFGRIAATGNGIWLEQNGHWQRTLEGVAWSAGQGTDGRVVVAMKGKGLLFSSDGRTWQPDPLLTASLAATATEAAARPLTLRQLVIDLHSGHAFFGAEGQWFWIDVLGVAVGLMAMTGIYMWWRDEKRKAKIGSL